MGNTPTVNLVNQDQLRLSYFSVQMSSSDRFRLILAPDEVKQATKNVLNSTWPIQDENHQVGFVEFKLQGSPWYNYGEEDLEVKYFLCSLIKSYYQIGWHLKASTDLERNSSETDVLFFQKLEPVDTSVICLSLNSSDKIRILSPENLYEMIKNCVLNGWPKGIQRERMFGLSYEIKLFGNPWTDWSRDSSDSYNIPILVLEIMRNLFKNGWLFVAAIDSGKRQSSLNALYFRYAPDQITKMDMENTRFFALTLNKSDRIRLHQSDQDLNALVSNQSYGIHSLWPRGIQRESMIDHALEFKLAGNPWDSHASEAVESRLLLNSLFNLFARYGWNLYATCDLTKHVTNKSTFFFRTKPIEPKSLVNFCLSLNESDKIRLINGDFGLASDVKEAVLNGWHKGIQKESDYFGSYQIKLNGNPFSTFGSDKVYTCAMMTFILSNLQRRGFKLLCSADVSQKYYSDKNNHYPVDLHTWFFEN
ncbi:hypothetical protein BpHYR1_049176 [Brachionus plicatilis]|uniref:Uncharacterized protein n=1 Tax=Brachionus plicatilis TaxID=10195 RepID=A0A3M7S894_BRAPC|nr:hypothetical protein BpHYR1_049176 [Brachionus plicatilis]